MTHPGECSEAEGKGEGSRPIWETAPAGVISLRQMVNSSAGDLYHLAATLTNLIHQTSVCTKGRGTSELLDALRGLCGQTQRLKLKLSLNAAVSIIRMVVEQEADAKEVGRQLLELRKRVIEELDERKFFCVPSEKTDYMDPLWLTRSSLYSQFPKALNELHRAGRCHAYGENTACAFHLNRALECGLKSLAAYVGKKFDGSSWARHIQGIEHELEARCGVPGFRGPEESFFWETLAQIGHLKVAWRNPTMQVEDSYDDNEGRFLLGTAEKFMLHLANQGLRESSESRTTSTICL